eukprot:1362918-Pyramimonas_sp.AAC.1
MALNVFPTGAVHDVLKVKVTEKGHDDDIAKVTTKEDQDRVRKVRAACKNTLGFAANISANRALYRASVVISE